MWHIWDRRDAYRVWLVDLRERDHLDNLHADGMILLKCIFEKWDGGGMNWINLAEDIDRCWVLVNVVMTLQIA